jgi:hypothetical protein
MRLASIDSTLRAVFVCKPVCEDLKDAEPENRAYKQPSSLELHVVNFVANPKRYLEHGGKSGKQCTDVKEI